MLRIRYFFAEGGVAGERVGPCMYRENVKKRGRRKERGQEGTRARKEAGKKGRKEKRQKTEIATDGKKGTSNEGPGVRNKKY